MSDECLSCGENCPAGECPMTDRECGHHCNHSWTEDRCCWCGTEFPPGLDHENDLDELASTGQVRTEVRP